MILVTVGTQDKPFTRLLKAVDQYAQKHPDEKIVVQAGSTPFQSANLEVFDYVSKEKMHTLQKQADLIITHGGVGNILSCLKLNKKVIAVPRLAQYKEHVNDHQIQIIEQFCQKNYILGCLDLNQLPAAIKQSKTHSFAHFISNNQNFVANMEHEIDQFLK